MWHRDLLNKVAYNTLNRDRAFGEMNPIHLFQYRAEVVVKREVGEQDDGLFAEDRIVLSEFYVTKLRRMGIWGNGGEVKGVTRLICFLFVSGSEKTKRVAYRRDPSCKVKIKENVVGVIGARVTEIPLGKQNYEYKLKELMVLSFYVPRLSQLGKGILGDSR